MRRRIPTTILSAAAGVVLLSYAGGSGAHPILATGPDADVTEEGLHRVDPPIMESAWVRPDLDLSRYTRIPLMPTAVQFREVDERIDTFSRTKGGVMEFPVDEENPGVGPEVLVVQGFLVDVVSHIPPDAAGSVYTWVRDPWIANVVLELRDATTAELLARTIDRRTGEGLLDPGTVWMLTDDLLERWAQVLSGRLEQLSDLGGRGRRTPTWVR